MFKIIEEYGDKSFAQRITQEHICSTQTLINAKITTIEHLAAKPEN